MCMYETINYFVVIAEKLIWVHCSFKMTTDIRVSTADIHVQVSILLQSTRSTVPSEKKKMEKGSRIVISEYWLEVILVHFFNVTYM